MNFRDLHAWELLPREAIAIQLQLADQIDLCNSVPDIIKVVAGVDVSYRKKADRLHAAIVVLDIDNMNIKETVTASGPVNFPYVPGLLSFRELPVLLQAFEKLQTIPEVVLVDGQGIAHPRKFGLASHLGLWLDLPTIGCAKNCLCGRFKEPAEQQGSWSLLTLKEEVIGRVVRTRGGVKPLFVSPGHKIGFERAAEIVLQCGRGYRLPEPTRQAHLISNQLRLREEFKGN